VQQLLLVVQQQQVQVEQQPEPGLLQLLLQQQRVGMALRQRKASWVEVGEVGTPQQLLLVLLVLQGLLHLLS